MICFQSKADVAYLQLFMYTLKNLKNVLFLVSVAWTKNRDSFTVSVSDK